MAKPAMETEDRENRNLTITDLSFSWFRNYPSFELHGIGPLTVLVGRNAIGKTNIIEGVQLLTALTSFRNPTGKQLIQWGEERAHLSASVKNNVRDLMVELDIREGKRAYSLNGKPKKIQTLKGLIPAVTFTPDDLVLIKGSQSGKRGAIDTLGSQLSSNYYVIRKDYEKIVQHKNRLLKDEGDSAFLDSIDETLVTVGTQLYCYRSSLFNKLFVWIDHYYNEITGGAETVSAAYVPSWIQADPEETASFVLDKEIASGALQQALRSSRNEERSRKRAVIGPHGDRIEFFIDGRNARMYASQGQQRSIVLSFKLAEVALIQEMREQKPLLLLDDVMSELDAHRRNALIGFISGDIQTFITTTNLQYFSDEIIDQARVVSLGQDDSSEDRHSL